MAASLQEGGALSVAGEVDAKRQLAEYEEDARSLQQKLASLLGPASGSGRPLQSVSRQVEDLYSRYNTLLQDNQHLLRLLPPSEAANEVKAPALCSTHLLILPVIVSKLAACSLPLQSCTTSIMSVSQTPAGEDADVNVHQRLAEANVQQELLRQEVEVGDSSKQSYLH